MTGGTVGTLGTITAGCPCWTVAGEGERPRDRGEVGEGGGERGRRWGETGGEGRGEGKVGTEGRDSTYVYCCIYHALLYTIMIT